MQGYYFVMYHSFRSTISKSYVEPSEGFPFNFLFIYIFLFIGYYVNAKYMLVNKNKYCPFHTCK